MGGMLQGYSGLDSWLVAVYHRKIPRADSESIGNSGIMDIGGFTFQISKYGGELALDQMVQEYFE